MDYDVFLRQKQQLGGQHGFAATWLPDFLFDFQRALVEWAVQQGRAALFCDCGLGKTPMQLVWAQNVVERTNKRVLILTPLAISYQTVEEARKFGIAAARCQDGRVRASDKIVVTNYERLHHFNSTDFCGVVCDESSILKNFDGATKAAVTEFMRMLPYRLLCTATAAPNDYIELGTSSEALGHLGYMDMLGMFFKNDQGSLHPSQGRRFGPQYGATWRFKPHAERPFWRWVCSWARAARTPSDLGFEDGRFQLPPLRTSQRVVAASRPMAGFLFSVPAVGLLEQRQERRHTIEERCATVAEAVRTMTPAIAWCHLNDEGDRLAALIPDSVQVSGNDPDEAKEEKFRAFTSGQARVLVTKPVIGALGLNLQHCAHMTFFPSHSFEQYYQGVRRCWRFGQTRPVQVDLITSEGESDVLANLRRKAQSAERMFAQLVAEMREAMTVTPLAASNGPVPVPSWMRTG